MKNSNFFLSLKNCYILHFRNWSHLILAKQSQNSSLDKYCHSYIHEHINDMLLVMFSCLFVFRICIRSWLCRLPAWWGSGWTYPRNHHAGSCRQDTVCIQGHEGMIYMIISYACTVLYYIKNQPSKPWTWRFVLKSLNWNLIIQ